MQGNEILYKMIYSNRDDSSNHVDGANSRPQNAVPKLWNTFTSKKKVML